MEVLGGGNHEKEDVTAASVGCGAYVSAAGMDGASSMLCKNFAAHQ